MLLITKSVPSHCSKSPAILAVGTKSKLPFVFLNAIRLEFPAVEPKLIEDVTAGAINATEEVNDVVECWYTKFTSAPATSNPAPSAVADEVEPLANVINLSSTTNVAVFNVTVLPCTTKSPPTTTSPVVVTFANVTSSDCPTPCIVPVPSNVVILPAKDELKVVWDAALAENEVATEELKSPVTLATLADNEVIFALLALNEDEIEPLNVVYPVVDVISTCVELLITDSKSNLSLTLPSV